MLTSFGNHLVTIGSSSLYIKYKEADQYTLDGETDCNDDDDDSDHNDDDPPTGSLTKLNSILTMVMSIVIMMMMVIVTMVRMMMTIIPLQEVQPS